MVDVEEVFVTDLFKKHKGKDTIWAFTLLEIEFTKMIER